MTSTKLQRSQGPEPGTSQLPGRSPLFPYTFASIVSTDYQVVHIMVITIPGALLLRCHGE